MTVYLIKMTACALLLYAVYALLLEREKMHRFKRIYLLGSLVFSMMAPFATMTINVSQMPANFQRHAELISASPFSQWIAGHARNDGSETSQSQFIVESLTPVEETPAASSINYSLIILSVYVLITSLFIFRLLKNSWFMLARGKKNALVDYYGAKIALMDEKNVPHSFGKYIFINWEDYDNGRVADEIVVHEWAHVRQRHTWDIVFIELLIAFGWFNPVFYLYKSKIRQNHEFLADDAVVKNNWEYVPVYQSILMNFILPNKNVIFTSNFNFNYLFTKKRIVMMYKTSSKKRAWCKSIALIPVFIVAICVFSTKIIAQNDLNTLQTNESAENQNSQTDTQSVKVAEDFDAEVKGLTLIKSFPVRLDAAKSDEKIPASNESVENQNSQTDTQSVKVVGDCDSVVKGLTLLASVPIRLDAAKSDEKIPVFKQFIAMRKENRYRFIICNDKGSAGEAILQLHYINKDETDQLVGSTYNSKTGSMYQSFDFDCDKTAAYKLTVTFKDGKEGSAVAGFYHVANLTKE